MTIESLIKQIQTEKPLKAIQAIRELGELQTPEAAEFLIELLHSGNVMMQQAAAEALAAYNEDHVAKALCSGFKAAPTMVRLQIVKSLERLNRPATIPCMMTALREAETESLQYTIIEALGNMHAVEALDLISGYLTHPNHHVRKRAHIAFDKLGRLPRRS
jgi:HEAT repeat protein